MASIKVGNVRNKGGRIGPPGEAGPMVVKVDENEPNVFPTVDATDVEIRAEGKEIDVVLITQIEGKSVRVRVKLNQAKAQILADQLASPRRVEVAL